MDKTGPAPEVIITVKPLSKWHRMTPEQKARHCETIAKWKARNIEHYRAQRRKYRSENPEKFSEPNKIYRRKNREKINATRSEWNAANPDKIKAMAKRSWKKNGHKYLATAHKKYWSDPDASRQYMRENYFLHLEKNRIMGRIYANNRRVALEKGPKMAPDTVYRLMAEQSGRCACCPADLMAVKFHIDHIIPVCKGGLNDPENLQLLCQPCNQSKHAKDMDAWLASRPKTKAPPIAG